MFFLRRALPSSSRCIHGSATTLARRPAATKLSHSQGAALATPNVIQDVANSINASSPSPPVQTAVKTVTYKLFKAGENYNPYDIKKTRRIIPDKKPRNIPPAFGPDAKTSFQRDPFRQLGYDPVKEAMNTVLLSNFVTDMGKIKGRNLTSLSRWSQRKVGKAVRRARNMGVIPILSKPNHYVGWSPYVHGSYQKRGGAS